MNKMMCMLAASLVAMGCGSKKKTCEAIYNMEVKCSKDGEKFDGKKDEFVGMCTKAFELAKGDEKGEADQMAACASKSSCDEYKACGDAADGKRRAKKVSKAMTEGKLKDAWSTCTISARYYADAGFKAECAKVFKADRSKVSADDLDSMGFACRMDKEMLSASPDLTEACKGMMMSQITTLTAAVTKVRDEGGDGFSDCYKLKSAATDAGKDKDPAIETLCKEADASQEMHKALADIKAAIAAKKSDVPYQCSSTVDTLKALDTPWGNKAFDELVKGCFVDLGVVVFAVENTPENSKYTCPYKIDEVLKADAKYGLTAKYPEFAAEKAKLPANCLTPAAP